MSELERHEALVAAALRRLGVELGDGSEGWRLLAGGLSGSSVYAVDLGGEQAILKLTPPGGDRHGAEQALREHRFYRDLATRLPIKVPRVLGLDLDGEAEAAILLAAYESSPPPDQWTEQDYTQVAQQLGQFHATFWDQAETPAMPEWVEDKPQVTLAQCLAAAEQWRKLSEREELRETLAPLLPRVERLLLQIPELDPRMITMPSTLCHGDCHTGNLLRDPAGDWVWADWQQVRRGLGVDDLAFLWQRAFAATDARPPYEAMMQAYRAGLKRMHRALLTDEQLQHNLAWSELRSWLVDWPGYLGFLTAAQIQLIVQRIAALMNRFVVPGES
jgi:Ser/Thr protein kinase RdoA (MazF antagonist)